jgi:hypothetical protein
MLVIVISDERIQARQIAMRTRLRRRLRGLNAGSWPAVSVALGVGAGMVLTRKMKYVIFNYKSISIGFPGAARLVFSDNFSGSADLLSVCGTSWAEGSIPLYREYG